MLIPEIVTAAPAVPAIGWLVARGAGRGTPPLRLALAAALVAYPALLAALVFFPLPLGLCDSPPNLQLRPLVTLRLTATAGTGSPLWWIAVGNVVAFAPLGFLVPLIRTSRRPVLSGLAVAFVGSVAVETGQLAIGLLIGCGYRATDIDDVILNTLGGLVGALLAAAAIRLKTHMAR